MDKLSFHKRSFPFQNRHGNDISELGRCSSINWQAQGISTYYNWITPIQFWEMCHRSSLYVLLGVALDNVNNL